MTLTNLWSTLWILGDKWMSLGKSSTKILSQFTHFSSSYLLYSKFAQNFHNGLHHSREDAIVFSEKFDFKNLSKGSRYCTSGTNHRTANSSFQINWNLDRILRPLKEFFRNQFKLRKSKYWLRTFAYKIFMKQCGNFLNSCINLDAFFIE